MARSLARIALGLVFVTAGLAKLFAHGATADAFARWGIAAPATAAWIVGAVETVCGLLCALGIFTRPVGLLLATMMIGAALTAGRAEGGMWLFAPLVVFGGCVWLAWSAGREGVALPVRPPGVQ